MKNYVGDKIKSIRKKKGLTQKELAAEIGCTEIMVSRYELGISQVSIPRLERIAGVLGSPISNFFETNRKSTKSSTDTYKKAFVFDLDDTLVDGRQFCGETIARVITQFFPSVDFDQVVHLHEELRGMTIEDLYIQILEKINIKTDVRPLLEQDHIIQRDNINKLQIFEGVVDILEFLKINDKQLYMCTNRTRRLLREVLLANKIFPYFDEVISCVDTGFKKPNPFCLVNIIERSGLAKEEFIYFGDSEIDALFAKNAEIDHIIFDQYMNNKNLFKKLINMFLEKQMTQPVK